jgi:hypothetical protein
MGGFMAQAGGIGAELAGALQGHRLGVEGAHEQHLLEQFQQPPGIAGGFGQVVADGFSIRAAVFQAIDLDLRGERHRVRVSWLQVKPMIVGAMLRNPCGKAVLQRNNTPGHGSCRRA